MRRRPHMTPTGTCSTSGPCRPGDQPRSGGLLRHRRGQPRPDVPLAVLIRSALRREYPECQHRSGHRDDRLAPDDVRGRDHRPRVHDQPGRRGQGRIRGRRASLHRGRPQRWRGVHARRLPIRRGLADRPPIRSTRSSGGVHIGVPRGWSMAADAANPYEASLVLRYLSDPEIAAERYFDLESGVVQSHSGPRR